MNSDMNTAKISPFYTNSGQPQTQVKDEWLSCVSVIPFKKAFCSLQGGWI